MIGPSGTQKPMMRPAGGTDGWSELMRLEPGTGVPPHHSGDTEKTAPGNDSAPRVLAAAARILLLRLRRQAQQRQPDTVYSIL